MTPPKGDIIAAESEAEMVKLPPYATLTRLDKDGNIETKELSYGDMHMPRTVTKQQAAEMMRNLLERCAKQFHFYADNHMKKDPPDVEKAKTNAQWGHYCRESVRYYDEAN